MPREYRVGPWVVQPELNRIALGDRVVRLEPKVMQVLDTLAERPGDVFAREELQARVWPDTFVTDDALHRAIRELRRVFGEAASQPQYIETIRKRGYRLIADVGAAPGVPSTPRPETPGVPRSRAEPAAARGFLIVAAGLVLVVAAAVAASAVRPAPAAADGRVRFVSLVSGPLNEFDPAPTADGRLAFAAFVDGDDGAVGQVDLFLLDAPGASPRRLTHDPAEDRYPAWSPDGGTLAFVRSSPAACEVIAVPVEARHLAPADTAAERRLAACGNAMEPAVAWSADGRWLVHSMAPDPRVHRGWQIARTAVASGAREALTLPPPGTVGDHSPVVSPDGRSIAFIRTVGGAVSDIYVVPFDGGVPRRLTRDDGDIAGLTWSDDGRAVVYSSDRAGGYSLWRVAAAGGGEPSLVAGGAAKLKHPRAADGLVAYEAWAYEINVWRVSLDDGGMEPVVRTSDLWNYHPQPSPGGRRLAFVSTRSGATEVWVADVDGGAPRRLTSFGRATVRAPRWSPDDAWLVVSALVGGHADLYLIDAATGETRRLTASPGDDVAPAWSTDGSRVYYGTRRDGMWHVVSHDVACALESIGTGAPDDCARVEIEHGYAAQPSPDGRALYYTRADGAGLWRQTLGQAGNPELVLPSVPAGDWANWQVGPQGIHLLARTAGGATALFHAPLDGGPVRQVAAVDELAWPGVAVTPDGRSLFYARADRRESNIAAVEVIR